MEIIETSIPGLLRIKPIIHGDDRGYFLESWNRKRYRDAGLDVEFLQDNFSKSKKGVLRGLHYQSPHSQGKLVSVMEGEVFDVAVDLRKGSPTFGQWESETLSSIEKNQFYVPAGFAHGFEVLSEMAVFHYKCTEVYHPECEHTLMWNDPDLKIPWKSKSPLISDKDNRGMLLKEIPQSALPG